MFIFDSDHLTILERRGSSTEYQNLSRRLDGYDPAVFFVSIVSFHESVLGANAYIQKAKEAENLAQGYERLIQVLRNFSTMQVLTFDEDAAVRFRQLRAKRVRIGTMDLRIASTALSVDFTVLTRNFADFEKVPGLQFEDWTVSPSNSVG